MNACNKLVVTRAELRGLDVPIVVDPVMEATTGSRLMGEGVLKILREELIPRATLVTPNKFEAEALTGLKIGGIDDVEKAAERLASLGAKAVLIKGGHILSGGKAIDFLLVEGEGRMLEWERLDVRTLHGTGCVLSSAVAAQLAKGEPLVRAVELGKEFQREHDVFTDLLRDEGIEVLMLTDQLDEHHAHIAETLPNLVYTRDVCMVSNLGAHALRMTYAARQVEPL